MELMTMAGLGLFVLVAAVASPFLGWVRVVSVCLVLSFAVAPYPLLVPDQDSGHFGLAHAEPIPLTFTLFLALLAPFILRTRLQLIVLSGGAAFTALLVFLNFTAWGSDAATWAGIIHFFTAAVALAVGVALAPRIRDDQLLRRMLAAALLASMVVQLVFCAAQLLGVNASVYDMVAYFNSESRPIGTFNHPSVLGKVLLLSVLILLPLTQLSDRVTKQLAWWAIALAVPLVAVTQARTNTVAVLAAIFLWFMLSRAISIKRKLLVAGAFALASIPVLAILLPRILRDPEGGDRAVLLETGLEQISREPWWGLGVNSYSQVVGQWDPLAAVGLPVHNTVLFLVAELGLVASLIFFIPVVAQLVLAWRQRRSGTMAGDASRAVWATTPGIVLIIVTGWGLVSGGTLSFWMFAIGISIGWMALENQGLGRTSEASLVSEPTTGSTAQD